MTTSRRNDILDIPLHIRVCEIRDEKKFSNARLEVITDLSDDTIGRLCKGVTKIKPKHIIKFAEAFDISPERLTRTDKLEENLVVLLYDRNVHPKLKVAHAQDFMDASYGNSEVSDAYRYLGQAFDMNNDSDKAEQSFVRSREFAIKSNDSYRIQKTTNNLLTFFNRHKKTVEAIALLKEIVTTNVFTDSDEENGKLKQNIAMIRSKEGNMDEAHRLYLECEMHFKECGATHLIGRIKHNIADILFHHGSVAEAAVFLEEAIELTEENDLHTLFSNYKDLSRAYICLEEYAKAENIIINTLKEIENSEYVNSEIHAKFILMLSDLTGNVRDCEHVFRFSKLTKELKANLADVFSQYFIKAGDAEKGIYYHTVMRDNINGVYTNYKRGAWF